MFASLKANNIARKPGKMICVKTLADQVREFMSREGIKSTAAMARLIPTTSRQSLSNMLKGDINHPTTYMPELAAVMRTTVDVLLAGAYVWTPKDAAPKDVEREPAPTAADLSTFASRIAAAMPFLLDDDKEEIAKLAEEKAIKARRYADHMASIMLPKGEPRKRLGNGG